MESAISTGPSGCLMRHSLAEIGFFSATGRVSSIEVPVTGLGSSGGGAAIGAKGAFTGVGVGASMGAGADDLHLGGFWLVRRFRWRQAVIALAVAPTMSAISTSLFPSSYSCRARFSSHVRGTAFTRGTGPPMTLYQNIPADGLRAGVGAIHAAFTVILTHGVNPSITLHKRRAFSAVGSFRQAVLAASVSRITLAWCSESFRSNSEALAALSH